MADPHDLECWRAAARPLALAGIAPEAIDWRMGAPPPGAGDPPPPIAGLDLRVPRSFVTLARDALRHDDPERFSLLYALLLAIGRDRAAAERGHPLLTRVEARMARLGQANDKAAAWAALRDEAMACTRCPLHCHATRTVFGEGPIDAALVLVGEQPGDQEDLQGRPFVGPAGKLLDAALAEAGIDRAAVYVTNAVKHFKFEPRGARRIHVRPEAPEIAACRWWIEQERALIRPRVVVALGATAAQSLLGRAVTISRTRGTPVALDDGSACHVTVHPSYLLRIPDAGHARAERERFTVDLAAAKAAAHIE